MPGGVAASYDAQRKRNRLAMVLVACAALIAALFGLKAAGLIRLGASSPSDSLPLSARNGNHSLDRSAETGNVLQKPADTNPAPIGREDTIPVMPPDVEAWLKHLEKCENMKVEIAGDQAAEVSVWMQKMQALGAGMGLMNPYDQSSDGDEDKSPNDYAKGKMMDLRPKWEQLIQFFNSVPPPAECQPLASDFNRALNQIPDAMGDLGEILNGAMDDPQKALQSAKKMQNGSYNDIDRYFGRADQKLSDICSKYRHNKWFNIKTDVLAGGMMGKFSTLGPGTSLSP